MEVGMTCRSSWMERPLFLGGMLFLLVVSVPGALSDEHDGDDDHDDDDLSPGAIAGICIGVIVAVSLIVLILVVLCQHDKTKKTHPPPLTLPPLSTKENTPHPVVLAVPGYAHDQPTYSHQMNTYYIPPPAERYMAPPNKGYPEVPLSGTTSGKEAEAVGPPTYAEITRSDEPPMKY